MTHLDETVTLQPDVLGRIVNNPSLVDGLDRAGIATRCPACGEEHVSHGMSMADSYRAHWSRGVPIEIYADGYQARVCAWCEAKERDAHAKIPAET